MRNVVESQRHRVAADETGVDDGAEDHVLVAGYCCVSSKEGLCFFHS